MATAASELPAGPSWTYEVKWDGYRTLAVKDGTVVRLFSRNLKNVTSTYPSIAAAAAGARAATAIIDGEVVALDDGGRPSFQALHHQQAHTLAFFAFDLLHLDGRDLVRLPLSERRRLLAGLVEATPILLSEPLPGDPRDIEQAVRRLGLEGVVAKRGDSRYEAGKRSEAWIKVRFAARQELVVGGFRPGGGSIDSVLVGYFDGKRLRFAGKVRAGFTPRTRALLFERIKGLEIERCPFVNLPSPGRGRWGEGVTLEDMKSLKWVRPRVVVEVAFTEWTRDGNLRHAAFVGLRTDRDARDVRREG